MSKEQSFMKAAFFGVVAEELIFPFPGLSTEEKQNLHSLVDQLRRFSEAEVDAAEIDCERAVSERVLSGITELGLFGLGVPEQFGGVGLGHTAHARVIQELAAVDASLALMLATHGAIGVRSLVSFGTDEQKQKYLPRLASGELLAAFALTEHASGTDAATIRTEARFDEAAGVWRLNGTKPWVTNGDKAGLITVFARTSRPDQGHKPRLTAFLVERGKGVESGRRHMTLGVRGAGVTPVHFDDVELGPEDVLGEPGKGYKVAMAVLNDARLVLSASMFGQARAIVNRIVSHVQERRSFGRVIGEFPILKDKIAKMMADAFAVESMTYLTTGLADRGVEDYSLESSICRVASVEALWRVVNEAMQIVAGRGYVEPDSLERHLRDARVGFVVDGTNETLRCFIALSGLRGPGEKLGEVESAMYEPLKGFGLLRRFAPQKLREALRRERLTRAHPLLAREAVMFEEATDELHQGAMRALRDHGREIAEMQYTQKRLANVAIDLYALAACLSRASAAIESRGEGGAQREIDLCTMFATAAQGRMRAHLARLEHNDDELRKAIASRAYTDLGYPFDVF